MKEILNNRVEFIFGIVTFTLISVNREVFGELSAIKVGAEAFLLLIIYDFIKYFLFSSNAIGPKWLLSGDLKSFPFVSINQIERKASADARIFVLTPDLFLDTQDTEIKKTVRGNLKKGTRYIFLTTDSPDMRTVIEDLLSIHGHSEQISVYAAKSVFIDGMASANIMIIHEPGSGALGFLQIPEGSGKWWCCMSRNSTKIYHDNMKYILQQADPRAKRASGEYSICRLIAGPPVTFLHSQYD